MTTEKDARELHRSFRVLSQFNGVGVLRNVTREQALSAWRELGHPLRDYVVACAATGQTIPGSLTDRVDAVSWLENTLRAAENDFQPFIDAITLHSGNELQLTKKAIDVLAERAASKNPVACPIDPNSPTIERRVHVREKIGDNRIIFLRAIELNPAGPLFLVDHNRRRLARFTIDASQFEPIDGWYEPTGGGGRQGRAPNGDDGRGVPSAGLIPRGNLATRK